MALSTRTKDIVEIALADKRAAKELSAAVDTGGNPVAAAVAAIVASNLTAVAGTYAVPTEPTGAEVDASVNGLTSQVETRLDALDSKVNAVIAALKAAGLMAP